MKQSNLSEVQIGYALRQAESGPPVGYLCSRFGISDATSHARKKQDAHLDVSKLRRLSSWIKKPAG